MEMDEDGGGEIEIEEFLEFYNLEQTAFSNRIFTEFDKDESGGQWHALIDYCGQHRRPVARSD